MTIPYVFRRPRFPVIAIIGTRAFRADSSAAVQRLLAKQLKPGEKARLLDQQWEWFEVMQGDVVAIAPSVFDYRPPKKASIIALINDSTNRLPDSPSWSPRTLDAITREQVFRRLLEMLPAK